MWSIIITQVAILSCKNPSDLGVSLKGIFEAKYRLGILDQKVDGGHL